MVKFHMMLIGLVVASMVIAGFALFLSGGTIVYGGDFNNSSVNSLNKMNDLVNRSELVKTEMETIDSDSNVLDILGSFFVSGYQAVLTTAKSVSIFDDMTREGLQSIGLGDYSENLIKGFGAIIIFIVFIGIVMAFIVKSERA